MKLSTIKFPRLMIIPAVVFVFASCVSNKKYEALQAMKTSCDQDLSSCRSTNSKLTSQLNGMGTSLDSLDGEYLQLKEMKNRLERATSEALKNKQAELDQKEAQLLERERRMKELQNVINLQRQAVNDLKNTISEALVGYAPDELSVYIKDGKLYVSLSEQLLFPSGSDKVNEKGTEALKKLARVIKPNEDMNIMVEGHTDNVPISTARFADNWDLSVHRSTSIIRILVENGVEPKQIIASGRGEYFPVAANETTDGRQSNRRTEIILAPKLTKLWEMMGPETANQ